MNCPFYKSNRVGPDCSRGKDLGGSFVYSTPSPSQVYDVALHCTGIPFRLGYSSAAGTAESDAIPTLQRAEETWQRTKIKSESGQAHFSNAFRGRQCVHPSFDNIPYHERIYGDFQRGMTSLLDRKNYTNVFTEKSKTKNSDVSPNLLLSLNFYYHFRDPQRVNPMLDGVHIHQDTRHEQKIRNFSPDQCH